MKHYEYTPENVCTQKISFDLEDGKIYGLSFYSGCNGNLKAIAKLLEGAEATFAIETLEGNTCGRRPTSCADQLTKALKVALESEQAEAQTEGAVAEEPAAEEPAVAEA